MLIALVASNTMPLLEAALLVSFFMDSQLTQSVDLVDLSGFGLVLLELRFELGQLPNMVQRGNT